MTRFEKASRSLHSRLAFLNRWGYLQLPDEVGHSAMLGDQLMIRYVSSVADRDLRIYFSPATATHADRLFVVVGSDAGHAFVVNDHLARCGDHDAMQPLTNASPERTITTFCRDAASSLRRAFEGELAKLMQGRTWSSPPFDWTLYK